MSLQEGLFPETTAEVKGTARISPLLWHFVLLLLLLFVGVPVVEENELQSPVCLFAMSCIRRMDDRATTWGIIFLQLEFDFSVVEQILLANTFF